MAAAGVLAADQLSKVVALGTLGLNGRELTIIPGLLSFQVIRNTGAAFGLFQSMGPLLAVMTMVVLYAMYKFARHEEDPLLLGSLTLILGGAAGNLVDRLVRGGVIDFISLPNWPVFNLADCAITVGAAGILFFGFIVQRSRVVEADAPDPT